MIPWKIIETAADIENIIQLSQELPCVIYKHSTRCDMSSMTLYTLTSDWDFSPSEIHPFFLDILQHQHLSSLISETFSVYHESPQVLLIRKGECTFETSHLDISVEEIRESYDEMPW